MILKALNYAVLHGAQIVNMSFAGPKDPLIERGIGATAARGIVMVAASGNAGAKSPPLYPAANANVIAVSATDAGDKLFAASNRGGHIAIAAPGVDIFLPAPDGKYQMTSGTSFSAAYVSGRAALMLGRNPALKRGEVRAILMRTARDLGSPGRDDQFGAGQADAFAQFVELDAVIYLEVPFEIIIKRISGRRRCPECGVIYHTSHYEKSTCSCGGVLYQREDDKLETVKNRLAVYEAETRPLIAYYSQKGLLRTVDGEGTPEEVDARIAALLEP